MHPRTALAVWVSFLLWACAGGRGYPDAGASGTRFERAVPHWAKKGDRRTHEGHVFVCEGEGANEEDAKRAAGAICNAKICELCGVEVEARVRTKETLNKIEVERSVVERCRRVRKSRDDVRAHQTSCGSSGCTSWLEVVFDQEAEARECRAYAQDTFEDPKACERWIETFRDTPGLTAASFLKRKQVLEQAIVACAEIDVRPTPLLEALNESLWSGVISPKLESWTPAPDEPEEDIPGRVSRYLANKRTRLWRDFAQASYRPMARQPLRETKVFVDRIALVRDAMLPYIPLMEVWARMARLRFEKGGSEDALLKAMERLQKVGRIEPDWVHFKVAEKLKDSARDWRKLRRWMVDRYPAASLSKRRLGWMAALFVSDSRLLDEEWAYLAGGPPCGRCLRLVFEHVPRDEKTPKRAVFALESLYGSKGQGKRVARDLLRHLSVELAVGSAAAVRAELRASLYDFALWDGLRVRLPAARGKKSVMPLRQKVLRGMRLRLKEDLKSPDRTQCRRLDKRLETLELEGVKTRGFAPQVCRCLREAKGARRIGELDALYLRALHWGRSCLKERSGA